jgi:S1-C subfamily serine protease
MRSEPVRRAAALALLTILPASPAAVRAGPIEEEGDQIHRLVERATPAIWLVEAEPDPARMRHIKQPDPAFRLVRRGAAFVWSAEDGLLIASASVVGDASGRRVTLVQPRSRVEAEVVGVDAETDVALLKVSAGALVRGRFLPLADAGAAKVGHKAFVVGPEKLAVRLGDGRINHTGFRIPTFREPLIVVNAAVDFGSAGSPVRAGDGRVIGMVYATGQGRPAVGQSWASRQDSLYVQPPVLRPEAAGGRTRYSHWFRGDGKGGVRFEVDAKTGPQIILVTPDGREHSVDRAVNIEIQPPPGVEPAEWIDLAFTQNSAAAFGAAAGGPTYVVPSETIAAVAEELRKPGGAVRRGQMGVWVYDAEGRPGAVIHRIVEGGPASRAGLAQGDVIIAVGGKAVGDGDEFLRTLRLRRAGEAVEVSAVTPSGLAKSCSVKLASVTFVAVPARSRQAEPPEPPPAKK